MNYTTTSAVTVKPPKRRNKTLRKKTGVTFPAVLTENTGIHIVQTLLPEKKLKIWYHVGGKKRYVTLPKGTSIEEARIRRDRLYQNLKDLYGAKRRTPKATDPERKEYTVSLTPEKYIYRRAPYIVKIRGKQIGVAATQQLAEKLRDEWLAANEGLVPLKKEVV